MEINTHGFEVDENEHDVVDKVYSELTPMLNPSRWVRLLRDRAGNEHKFACMDSQDWQIADYIEQLERERDQAWNAAIHKASAIAKSGVEAYGAKMRVATDKKEKRDWQSMLMAAVDIEHAILTLLKGAKE